MSSIRFLMAVAGVVCVCHCHAQRYDTLGTVEKKAFRISGGYGIKNLSIDTATLEAYQMQQVATLLAQQLPVFVRSYGVNGLATLSLRGASAAQTAVRWNGIPLQSGTTGLVDLMLIPVAQQDDVSVEYGSNSGRTGSGAVGGVLFLENKKPVFRPAHTYAAFAGIGSFGRVQGGVRLQQSVARWEGTLVATAQQTRNDFNYTGNDGVSRRLEHGALSSGSLQASLAWKSSSKSRLQGFLWMDKYKREIPAALFEAYSAKAQQDAGIRSALFYHHEEDRYHYGVRIAQIDEWFKYQDSVIAVNTNIHTRQWYAEPYFLWLFNERTTGSVAIPQQWNYIIGAPGKEIYRSAVMTDLRSRWNRLSVAGNFRAESVNGKVYGAGGVNADYSLHRSFKIRASAGNTYRTPTLNELYYTPGGNKDLLPEQGWSTEAGYTWQAKWQDRIEFTHSTTTYYRNIKNWILWLGGAIWTPHNIARVESKGLETENKWTYRRPKASWQLTVNATVISSRTMESQLPGDGSIGHQIPYAPRLIGQGNIGYTTRSFRLNYNQTYTGVRYFNSDETGEIAAFTTGNVQAAYTFKVTSWTLDLALQAQNIWNSRYAEVAGRPAPGINYLFGIGVREKR